MLKVIDPVGLKPATDAVSETGLPTVTDAEESEVETLAVALVTVTVSLPQVLEAGLLLLSPL
jgi:hypothetical protein